MTQKDIRPWDGNSYTNSEGAELIKELNDRTESSQLGYNSMDELATKVKDNFEKLEGFDVTLDGLFIIEDENSNVAFKIDELGFTTIEKFSNQTENLIKYVTGYSNKVNGKNVSILGDSISTSNGGGSAGLVYPQQYWGQMEVNDGCTTYVNAEAGSTIMVGGTGTAMSTDTRINTLDDTISPEVILIFGGINDFLQDLTLGTFGDTGNSTSFYGALDYMYRKILTDYGSARVFHMTPLHTTYATGGGLIPEFNGVNYLTEYIDAIKKVANRYGVGVIDTNQDSGITAFNIGSYATDLIHVNASGHKRIYDTIISETNFKL